MEKAIFVLSVFIQVSFVITFFIFLFIATYGKTNFLFVIPSMICIGLISWVAWYKGYRNRQITYFTTTFSIIGIILILFGSVIEVPYSTWQSYREDTSRDVTVYLFCPSEDRPFHDNGSVRKVTFPPLSEKKYTWGYAFSYFTLNKSIIQIDIATSGLLIFKIAELEEYYLDVKTIFLNRTVYQGYNDDINLRIGDWVTYFWTPPTSLSNYVGFVFENPRNRSIVFSFKITLYDLKSTDKKEVTNYQTLVDPYFAYGGIALIGASILLEVYSFRKKKQSSSPRKI